MHAIRQVRWLAPHRCLELHRPTEHRPPASRSIGELLLLLGHHPRSSLSVWVGPIQNKGVQGRSSSTASPAGCQLGLPPGDSQREEEGGRDVPRDSKPRTCASCRYVKLDCFLAPGWVREMGCAVGETTTLFTFGRRQGCGPEISHAGVTSFDFLRFKLDFSPCFSVLPASTRPAGKDGAEPKMPRHLALPTAPAIEPEAGGRASRFSPRLTHGYARLRAWSQI